MEGGLQTVPSDRWSEELVGTTPYSGYHNVLEAP